MLPFLQHKHSNHKDTNSSTRSSCDKSTLMMSSPTDSPKKLFPMMSIPMPVYPTNFNGTISFEEQSNNKLSH